MKIQKIVAFGDSWVYGDELLDPQLSAQDPDAHCSWTQNTDYRKQHCFLGLLEAHYQLPGENFGIAGGSLQSAIWTYLYWLQHEPDPEQCVVLIFLTEPDRVSFYNPRHVHYSNDPPWNKFVHSTWVKHGSSVVGPEFVDLIKKYLVLTHDRDLSTMNFLQSVMFFDGISARRKIPTLQFHGTAPIVPIDVPTLKWPEFDWITYFRDHPENQDRGLIMPGGHPNERGHKLIRDMLIPEIDRVILTE